MRVIIAAFLVLSAGLLSGWSPRLAAGSAASSCPQGVGLGDGCPAPNGGTFTVANCFPSSPSAPSPFRQVGQTWTTARPGTWNWPACDYPIGAYTPAATMLSDARYDPMQATLPSGCTPHATGYPPNTNMGYLDCSCIPAVGAATHIAHLYFGPWTGPGAAHEAMALVLKAVAIGCSPQPGWGSGGPKLYLDDAYFVGDAANTDNLTPGSGYGFIWADDGGHLASFYGSSITFLGYGSQNCCNAAQLQAVGMRITGDISFDYTAWDDIGNYMIDAGRGAESTNTLTLTHSWFHNCVQRTPMGHGECTHGALWNTITFDYDVWLLDSTVGPKQSLNHLGSGGTQTSAHGPLSLQHQLVVMNFGSGNITGVTFQVVNGVTTLQSNLSAPITPGFQLPNNLFFVYANISGTGQNNGDVLGVDCAAQLTGTVQCPPNGGASTGSFGLDSSINFGPSSGTAIAPFSNFSLADWGSDKFTTVTVANNYYDPVGVSQGTSSTRGYMGSPTLCGTPAAFSYNVNLESGAGNNTTAGDGGNQWSFLATGSGC